MNKKPPLTTQDIKARLAARFGGDEWATFFEVPDKTGTPSRFCDCMAFNLWPSRGFAVHGFEIKASRSDWLRELKQPSKANPFFSRVNYWWLVVGNPSIVKRGELPDGWGLIVPSNQSLEIKQTVKRRDAEPITPEFFAAILRSVVKRNQKINNIAIQAIALADQLQAFQ